MGNQLSGCCGGAPADATTVANSDEKKTSVEPAATVQTPPEGVAKKKREPILQDGPEKVEGVKAEEFSTSGAATAEIKHPVPFAPKKDQIVGDGNPAAIGGGPPVVSRAGLLRSKADAQVIDVGSCGPEVDAARKALMERVRLEPLGGDGDAVYSAQWEERWDNFLESRDPHGETLIKTIVAALESSDSEHWTDPDFPPNNSSLFKNDLTTEEIEAIAQGEQTFRKDQDAFLSGVQGIEWKRAAELLNPDEPVAIWSGDVHSDDIQQGRLGNCYFLAALASCAVGEKDILIRDLIVEEGLGVGVFGVKFYIRGRWITVPVDDYFPCTLCGDQWRPIFSSPSTGDQQAAGEKEIWPMIFEKAWAKLHGSYEATASGLTCDALNYLSGGIVRNLPVHTDNEEEWLKLLSMQTEHNKHEIAHDKEHNPFLTCSVRSGVDSEEAKHEGLVDGHAYSVLCVTETSGGLRLLNLRNPWGSFEWKGDYSDDSDKWTDELKAEVGADDAEGDDGSFWMCWADFCKYFEDVGVCDPMYIPKLLLEEGEAFPDRCHTHIQTVGSEWKPGVNAGGRPGFCPATKGDSTTFKYNPSFSLKTDAEKVLLQMYQPDQRGSQEPMPWADMYLFLLDESATTDADGNACEPQPKRIMSLNRRQKFIEIDVEPGKVYRLIATAWGTGVSGRFWISAAAKDVELGLLESPKPDEAAAELMAAKEGPASGPEALCVHCGEGPITGSYLELEEGQCHSDCHEAYDLERKKCTAPLCGHCAERILDSTWSVFKGDDGAKLPVHTACVDAYKESQAPKCEQCAAALIGGYVVLGGKNLHSDCVDAYREAIAPKCPQCNKAVLGSYYPYDAGDTISGNEEKVHVDCSDDYDTAVREAQARP